MAVPANVVVAWPSTAASIPSGWSRVTELDSRYVVGASAGADADLVTSRGNATHTHTSPSHAPVQDAHVHAIDDGGYLGPDVLFTGGTPSHTISDVIHFHTSFNSGSTTATNTGVAITVDATANDLAYMEVIWIKSDGTPTALPANCYAFFDSDSLPAGWSRAAAGKYLKGATAGGNGGGTGGSNTHVHTSPAHTHGQSAHTHFNADSPTAPESLAAKNQATLTTFASINHVHSVSLLSSTATNQSVTTTINSSNHEPVYRFLNAITSASSDLPTNVICIWISTNASIPAGWTRYTSQDGKWTKASSANGDAGTTGGAIQHDHTASSCQPVQDAHTHTASDPGPSVTDTGKTGLNPGAGPAHTHAWVVNDATATNQSASVTINSCAAEDAYPLYRTVIFIQFTGSTPPVVRPSCYTSYDVGRFDTGGPEAETLPEVSARIARHDRRFMGG